MFAKFDLNGDKRLSKSGIFKSLSACFTLSLVSEFTFDERERERERDHRQNHTITESHVTL